MNMNATQESTIKFLISRYNFEHGTRYRFSTEELQRRMLLIIEKDGYDQADFLKVIKADTTGDIYRVCDEYFMNMKSAPQVQEQPQATNLDASLQLLSGVVTNMLSAMKLDEIKAQVATELQNDVKQFIADNYGPIQRKIEFSFEERKVTFEGVVHSKFEQVLKFVKANEPVYLAGPAGSGKNVICQQVAKTLGLNFYFSNAVTQEYKLTGFTDANGIFHESQFYKAFKNGGVFMLDEMDASIPEVLIILNAALANGYFDFPAPIGYVEAHKDFRVIAAGNTYGNGADYDYVGRSQLDAASLDRFALIRIDYDSRIEEACAMGDSDLLGFCRAFRKASQKAGIRTVVSYRAIKRMAKLSQCMEADEVLDTCLIKSLELDDLKVMEADLAGYGKYSAAYRKVIAQRKAA